MFSVSYVGDEGATDVDEDGEEEECEEGGIDGTLSSAGESVWILRRAPQSDSCKFNNYLVLFYVLF